MFYIQRGMYKRHVWHVLHVRCWIPAFIKQRYRKFKIRILVLIWMSTKLKTLRVYQSYPLRCIPCRYICTYTLLQNLNGKRQMHFTFRPKWCRVVHTPRWDVLGWSKTEIDQNEYIVRLEFRFNKTVQGALPEPTS